MKAGNKLNEQVRIIAPWFEAGYGQRTLCAAATTKRAAYKLPRPALWQRERAQQRFNLTIMANVPPLIMKPAMPVPLSPALSRKRARGITSRYASFTLNHRLQQHGIAIFSASF